MAITKSAFKKAVKKQYVRVNDVVASTATILNGGETIQLEIPAETGHKKKLDFPLKVLFEDDQLAIIHKPAGILVSGNRFKTIANALVQNIKSSALPDAANPQPVHRLDFPTTGVLLIGKTRSSIRALNKMFEDNEIDKTYYAVTIGKMDTGGKITSDVEGKKSLTEYIIEQSIPSERFGTLNLLKLDPKTGRRHQLRIHLSGIGNPILGDKEYGTESLILKGKGLYLHAYSLKFTHPFTNEDIHIKDELPEKFIKIFPKK